MNNQNNGYGQSNLRSGGRMSASKSARRESANRPSQDELAPYKIANYTSRGSKSTYKQTKRRYLILAIVAACVLLIIVPGIALAASAKSAVDDAKILMNQGSALVNQIQAGDVEGAQRTAQNFGSIAKELDGNVNSPLWVPLTLLPVYGGDVRSVRTLASIASELSEQVVIPMTQMLPSDSSARLFVDGGFNIPVIQALLTPIGSASGTIQNCVQRVNEMSDPHLSQLITPIMTLKKLMGVLGEVSGYAGDLSQALPGLLGVNGPRTYLIVACTEAELRSVGGFPGSAGIMTIDNGKITVGEMNAPTVPYVTPEDNVLPLTDEERVLFGSRAGECFYDGGYNPDFPRAAEIMKSIWDADSRQAIDGILSVDPMFLQKVLELTGSVTTSDGIVVDGTNAAEILSNTVYTIYSTERFVPEATETTSALAIANARQNAFFGEVASLALDGFFENIGSVDILKAVQVLGESISDKRIYMWVTNLEEQAILEKLGAACAMSVSEEEPELGVYLATSVATKGNWYVKCDTTVGSGVKNADGSTTYAVTTRITNTLSPDEAASLPSYVVNPDKYAEDRIRSMGDMILDVYLFAPMGGFITDVQVEGSFAPETLFDDMSPWYTRPGTEPMTQSSYNGREVWYGVTMIEGLQSTVLTYKVTTSTQATTDLSVDTTPLAQEWD